MSKFKVTNYRNKKGILKFPDHYVNLAITVSAEGIVANAQGRKIVPAGTIVGGGFLTSESIEAVKANGTGAEGILFNDVDVTHGSAPGAALIHGFIALDKLPEEPSVEAKAALKQITFLK